MIDETSKLDEFEPISEKYSELLGYFLEKSVNRELSTEDEDRFFRILERQNASGYMAEFLKDLGSNPDKAGEIFKVGLEMIKGDIKNS